MKLAIIPITASLVIAFDTCQVREQVPLNTPENVRHSLIESGPNQSELIKVISHYSNMPQDSLKLKAAYFLIANMDRWHYYEGKILDDYIDYIIHIRSKDTVTQRVPENILDSMFGHFSFDKLTIKYDIREIRSSKLIENIDLAFNVWRTQPWGHSYSFLQFCEFILPYKMGDSQPEYNRREIHDKYLSVLNQLKGKRVDAVTACALVNGELQPRGWDLLLGESILPHLPASKLLGYQTGSCREQADLGAYVMRSLGIPVAEDFVPQWPNRSLGHDFVSVIDSNGRPHMFGAGDNNPGLCMLMQVPKGKVYRHTVETDSGSLAVVKDKQESIPSFLRDSCIKDVTDEYGVCSDVTVRLAKTDASEGIKHAYLCLFNNKTWIPVAWGQIKGDSCRFSKMERGILYLPGYYEFGEIIPAGYPFILKWDGTLQSLNPGFSRKVEIITLRKIFPILKHYLTQIFGNFQAANSSDFHDSTLLYSPYSEYRLQQGWNTKKISLKDSFRYIRYSSSRQCIIGDMQVFAQGTRLKGKIIASGPSLGEPEISATILDTDKTATPETIREHLDYSPENAFDSSVGTSFISEGSRPAWIGMDLGHHYVIDSIAFSPGISVFGPRCYIKTGHTYELNYWKNGRWVPLGTAIAQNSQVTFRQLPSNALFILYDLNDLNIKRRCFTIQNGEQIWW
jgi:hypothetical protein